MNPYTLDHLCQVEQIIIQVAQQTLMPYFQKTKALKKNDGSIVTQADLEVQTKITEALALHFPDVLMLGEEMSESDQQQILDSDQAYWCLDPLDGTNNFLHRMLLFSISFALISQQQLKLALVYDPIRKECFSALQGGGLRLNHQLHQMPPQADRLRDSLAFIDLKRLNSDLTANIINNKPYKSQRNIGSCALEWAWLATGRAQLLLHGGEKYWDYAGGVLLLQEAGGRCLTHEGEKVFNNSIRPRSIIAASTLGLFDLWQQQLVN